MFTIQGKGLIAEAGAAAAEADVHQGEKIKDSPSSSGASSSTIHTQVLKVCDEQKYFCHQRTSQRMILQGVVF